MKKNIALVLSGSGHLDGSEITEAVSALIALSELNANVSIFAPNRLANCMNHLTQEQYSESRNALEESARIARGNIQDLSKLEVDKFDALVLPGGYGAAKVFSDFASMGAKAKIQEDIKVLIQKFHSESKPIAAICVAPHLLALALKNKNICISLGATNSNTNELQKAWNCDIIHCEADDFVTDRENKIISAPAYMYDSNPFTVYTGIRKALFELIEMA